MIFFELAHGVVCHFQKYSQKWIGGFVFNDQRLVVRCWNLFFLIKVSRRNFLLQFFKLMPDFLGKLVCIEFQLLKKLFEKPGVFFLKAAGTVTVKAKSPVLREGNTTVGVNS